MTPGRIQRVWEYGRESSRLKGWAAPWIVPTATFIRDFLIENKEAYPQQIWRELKKARAKAFGEEKKVKVGSYQSFRMNYIYVLKKLGLIEPTRTEKVKEGWFPRVYYRIVAGKENDPRWEAPQKAFDTRRALGRSKYKKLLGGT